MTPEQLKALAEKIQNNTATTKESIAFFKALNEILNNMSTILRGDEEAQ